MKVAISKDLKIHMCDFCSNDFPECQPKVIEFGNGLGNDNVVKCSAYYGSVQEWMSLIDSEPKQREISEARVNYYSMKKIDPNMLIYLGDVDDFIQELEERNKEMRSAMIWFIQRVRNGEISSKKTYTRFVEIIEKETGLPIEKAIELSS